MIEILPIEDSWGMPLQVTVIFIITAKKKPYLRQIPVKQFCSLQKMRTLLALLLKKISTPGRLKKLGFGTRLIDEVTGEVK